MRMLAVDPGARRRGIGERLVRACIERATEDERAAMVLLTETFMVEAQRIYERLGFVRTPERDWQYAEDVLLIAYVLTIHPPSPA